MKKRIRINYIFWKEGPLLPRLLEELYAKFRAPGASRNAKWSNNEHSIR